MYRKYFKRLFDFIFSLIVLIVLSPILSIIAILVRIKLGPSVIFKQKRPGLNEKIFTLYKFRTMTNQKDEQGNLLPDELRLTKFGKMLRSTSLDELPELWNILKGDMSLIGPRPLLKQYLNLYNKNQKRRHEVKPGLSGYAQINGRNAITWEEKFKLDIIYVDNLNFLWDLKIMIVSVKKVVCKEGIVSIKNSTVDQFKGSNDSLCQVNESKHINTSVEDEKL